MVPRRIGSRQLTQRVVVGGSCRPGGGFQVEAAAGELLVGHDGSVGSGEAQWCDAVEDQITTISLMRRGRNKTAAGDAPLLG